MSSQVPPYQNTPAFKTLVSFVKQSWFREGREFAEATAYQINLEYSRLISKQHNWQRFFARMPKDWNRWVIKQVKRNFDRLGIDPEDDSNLLSHFYQNYLRQYDIDQFGPGI